jgi:hypothetical protein
VEEELATTATGNLDFRLARAGKKDEFYTSLHDVEIEMRNYSHHFLGKVVYCNCDDPRSSNFFKFFHSNFESLGLKKLIATAYRNQDPDRIGSGKGEQGLLLEYSGDNAIDQSTGRADIGLRPLRGDGDFRSDESMELLQQADIVVTNPPFSLFREYVRQLFDFNKSFLILGNMNAVTYKEIFPLFQENKMWYGPSIRSGDREFRVPDDYPLTASGFRIDDQGNKFVRVKGIRWFTNLDFPRRHEDLELSMKYDPATYPKYVNFDAIDVSRTRDIPVDYPDVMGVPISFLDKHNPKQFEIIGSSQTLGRPMSQVAERGTYQEGGPRFYLPKGDGTFRRMYDRIVIRSTAL